MSTADFNLPWEDCGNLIRDKRAADGSGGFLMAEVPANMGDSCCRAEFIVRACNNYDALVALLKEASATLKMWGDVAPAVSLVKDIDAALAAAGVQP